MRISNGNLFFIINEEPFFLFPELCFKLVFVTKQSHILNVVSKISGFRDKTGPHFKC